MPNISLRIWQWFGVPLHHEQIERKQRYNGKLIAAAGKWFKDEKEDTGIQICDDSSSLAYLHHLILLAI